MSATTTAVTSTTLSVTSATPAACTGAGVYEIPTKDAACAVPVAGNNTDALHQCCKDASVEDYDHGCGSYCLAQGQDVGELQNCLFAAGVKYQDVFCSTNQKNATASGSVTSSSTASSTGSSTKSATGSASTATHSSAAVAVVDYRISKSGVGLLAMMFCSALLGAFA